MSRYRIPSAEFRDVILENITDIALLFDQTEPGTLFIADLALKREVSPERDTGTSIDQTNIFADFYP